MEKYLKYRETEIKLNGKMTNSCLERSTLYKSAELLGIASENTIEFDSKNETSVLMDFALNDYILPNNKNTIQVYREKIGYEDEIEKDILDSLISSHTSLFKITSRSGNILILKDFLNYNKNQIKLIDFGLSKTAFPGMLLFTRLVPFGELYMTSGVSFVFDEHYENYLLRRYRVLARKVDSRFDNVKRFVTFYKLNKTHGLDIRYASLPMKWS